MIALPPQRLAKLMGVGYAGAVTVILLKGIDAPDGFLFMPFVLLWIIGPVGLAGVAADISQDQAGAWAFAALEAALIASTGWFWFYLIYVAPDAQNGIAMAVTMPFFQYLAVGAFFLCAMAFGWRAKSQNLQE